MLLSMQRFLNETEWVQHTTQAHSLFMILCLFLQSSKTLQYCVYISTRFCPQQAKS
jgi:hypothetical protein